MSSADQTLADDVFALAELLRPALLRTSRRLRNAAQKAGLSAVDATLLGHIRKHPGVGVCDLADTEQMARPTMSAHVKRLEAAGLIARRTDRADGRRSVLEITPEGVRRIETIRRHRNDWLVERLGRLTHEDRARLGEAAGPLLQLATLET
ncbi:MarR family winged helix-turn-helix transcriptional regulator [Phenylobacterium sp.]|uniref:MarR family winged helix-turn-helix transcriptional regulator n=1 Tax=Phenylobacterium sp. TaxID=1871053 RepID=UPI002736F474|nr:MarR family transcriptional regulator [Phenylobacterium sp.]MDP3660144.1 MarR family transcriptional regulator [Phenylobacterium sp.]